MAHLCGCASALIHDHFGFSAYKFPMTKIKSCVSYFTRWFIYTSFCKFSWFIVFLLYDPIWKCASNHFEVWGFEHDVFSLSISHANVVNSFECLYKKNEFKSQTPHTHTCTKETYWSYYWKSIIRYDQCAQIDRANTIIYATETFYLGISCRKTKTEINPTYSKFSFGLYSKHYSVKHLWHFVMTRCKVYPSLWNVSFKFDQYLYI